MDSTLQTTGQLTENTDLLMEPVDRRRREVNTATTVTTIQTITPPAIKCWYL
jgi:hypothetical protein